MEEDEEDDMYAPDEGDVTNTKIQPGNGNAPQRKDGALNEDDEEEGEEGEEVEEEESDSVRADSVLAPANILIAHL